jgi:hypothetical protein
VNLIITHKFLEPLVERDAKAGIISYLFDATWLATIACKNVPKDMGNDKAPAGGSKPTARPPALPHLKSASLFVT